MFPLVALLAGLLGPRVAGDDGPCPYCRGEPELLKAAGLVSHGPFPFAKDDTEKVRKLLAPVSLLFLESAHFRIGSSLEAANLSDEEEKLVRAELEVLRKALPLVPAKSRRVDPWLRLHLYAQRAEAFYGTFQGILGVRDDDFPAVREAGTPYMGEGRYLGEKEKYEILLHSTTEGHKRFLVSYTGTQFVDSERWHFQERHAIHLSIPCVGPHRREKGLLPHLVHGLSHMFLAGYKHYSYEAPLWLDEGLAHWCERQIDPESNTFDADEGTLVPTLSESDWETQTLKILARGKAEPLPNLIRKKAYAEVDVDDHVVCWSKVDFLLRTRRKEFAAVLGKLKGRLDAKGRPDAADLPGVQRDAFREHLGWNFAEFDREWEAWVRKTYPPK